VLGYDTSDDTLLFEVASAIEHIESVIDQYCGSQFDYEQGVRKVFNGSGTPMLTLGFWLRRLESVWMLSDTGERVLQLTDCVAGPTPLRRDKLYMWLERRQTDVDNETVFEAGLQNVEVIGDWGWKTEDMPSAVKMAVAHAVRHFFNLREHNDLLFGETGLGQGKQYNVNDTLRMLPVVSRAILDKYHNKRWMTG